MSSIPAILGGPLAQAIGWALVQLLWQGVLVAAILAAALALLQRRSANARYFASCAALVALLLLGAATTVRTYNNSVTPVAPVIEETTPAETTQPIAAAESTADTTERVAAPTTITWLDRAATVVAFASGHLPQIVLLWLVGVTFFSTRLVVGWIGAYRMAARYAHPASADWQRTLARTAAALKLRRAIRLLESAAVEVPTVIGWMRPVVLLPIASLSGLTPEQIEMILAHELAHIRRHDFIVNLLQAVVETLLFYHPAVWWISSRIRVEREHCCDDVAVAMFGDPLQYARALTRFEELRLDPAHAVLASNGGSLLTRIRRLVGARGESANWSSQFAAGAGLLTVLGALILIPSLSLFADHLQQAPAAPPQMQSPPGAPQPDAKHDSEECDKARAPHAEMQVDAESDTDAESDDPSTDADDDPGMSDAEVDRLADEVADAVAGAVAPSPMVRIHPMPKIDVNAMIQPALAIAMAPRAFSLLEQASKDGPKRKIGEGGKLTVDDLIELRAAGVDAKYIEQMRAAGLGADLSLNDLVALRIQGVTPDYLRGLREAGLEIKSADTAIALRTQGVTPKWLASIKSAGINTSNVNELVALRAQGVSGEYIAAMRAAGYPNLTTKELIALRVQGVSPAFVKSLADAGYTNLSVNDLIRLAANGVDAEFIRELAKYRTK
jgi:beta-lactamase regulating signal transducer with metallopeptidase domain